MRLALFGATGTIGQRILREALARGHSVTALVRDPSRLPLQHPDVRAAAADVLDPGSVAAATAGHDAVISAFGPGQTQPPESIVTAAHSLLRGLAASRVPRLLVVGGAGSLEVSPGLQLLDTPAFPAAWKPLAVAHRDALEVYRTQSPPDLDWTYLSPADLIRPGPRTGRYRTAADQLLTDPQGQSRISAEDFAVALLDELEQNRHPRQRFTVAY